MTGISFSLFRQVSLIAHVYADNREDYTGFFSVPDVPP